MSKIGDVVMKDEKVISKIVAINKFGDLCFDRPLQKPIRVPNRGRLSGWPPVHDVAIEYIYLDDEHLKEQERCLHGQVYRDE